MKVNGLTGHNKAAYSERKRQRSDSHKEPMAQEEQVNIPGDLLARVTNSAGIFQLLGIRIEAAQDGIGRVRVKVDERLMHPQMIVHGGVIFTLADTAMSMAILSVNPAGTRTGTIEAKINYLQPVRAGELLAEANIVYQGRSTAVLEATVFNIVDGKQQAIARLLGTFSVARPKGPATSAETGTDNNNNEQGK